MKWTKEQTHATWMASELKKLGKFSKKDMDYFCTIHGISKGSLKAKMENFKSLDGNSNFDHNSKMAIDVWNKK